MRLGYLSHLVFFVLFEMFLVVFGVLLAAVSVVPIPQEMSIREIVAAEKKCLGNYPPDLKDYLRQLKRTRVYPENPTQDFKCFMDCMGEALGLFDDQGNYHEEKLKIITQTVIADSSVTIEELHQAVEECIKVDHQMRCEKAHMYVECKHGRLKHAELHEELKKSTD